MRYATVHEGFDASFRTKVLDRRTRMVSAGEVVLSRQTPSEDDGDLVPDENLVIKVMTAATRDRDAAIGAAISLTPADARQLAETILKFFPDPVSRDKADASEDVISALGNMGVEKSKAERAVRLASRDLASTAHDGNSFQNLFRRASSLVRNEAAQ